MLIDRTGIVTATQASGDGFVSISVTAEHQLPEGAPVPPHPNMAGGEHLGTYRLQADEAPRAGERVRITMEIVTDKKARK
jgi:hypothetical protein